VLWLLVNKEFQIITVIVLKVMQWRTTRAKSRRWSMSVLYYLLDTTRVNGATIRRMQQTAKGEEKKISQIDFGWQLVADLVTPHMEERRRNPRFCFVN